MWRVGYPLTVAHTASHERCVTPTPVQGGPRAAPSAIPTVESTRSGPTGRGLRFWFASRQPEPNPTGQVFALVGYSFIVHVLISTLATGTVKVNGRVSDSSPPWQGEAFSSIFRNNHSESNQPRSDTDGRRAHVSTHQLGFHRPSGVRTLASTSHTQVFTTLWLTHRSRIRDDSCSSGFPASDSGHTVHVLSRSSHRSRSREGLPNNPEYRPHHRRARTNDVSRAP